MIDKKELTKRTRDENIRISEIRNQPKTKGTPDDRRPGPTKEQIRKALKPRATKTAKKENRPFLILKEQKNLLAEKDIEVVEEISKSYIEQSKYGDGKIKDKGDLRQKNLYFSNVGNCPREIYYKFFEPERARDYTVKGLILFDDGDRHHQNIQRRLEDRGKIRNPEGFLEIPEIGATGYYDGLWNVGVNNGWAVCDMLEIKSKLPYACEEIEQRDYDQAQLYHYASQFSKRLKTKRIKVRNIRILYKDRAVQTDEVHFAWVVKPDPERQQKILEYFRWLKAAVIEKKFLSPHPFEKKSTKCQWCRFREWCWREYPEEVVPLKTDEEEIQLPEQEILESFAKRLFEILTQEAAFRKEKKKLEKILIHYFIKTKNPMLPVTETEALAPKQGSTTEWDYEGLRQAIGYEMFARISKPDSAKITDLIHREFVDAAKFEIFKKKKLNKPSIYIKKI